MEKAIDNTAKALASLGNVGSKDQGASRGFQNLIKLIGEAKTKHEEDRIIRRESLFLKDKVGGRDITPRQMREYLIRLIYCEMLGVECSWGYIHAVKMIQSHSIMDKRVGYLAVSLFLHENHELNMLLINTLQRDLKSSNILEVSMALIIICKLIGAEMIPPLLPAVQEKLLHPKDMVRKKAIMAMHHFYKLSPEAVAHLEDDFRRCLSDKDPGVMEAALILFQDLVKDDPAHYKDLAASFSDILSQVINRKLPLDFDYHGVPAPWIQIRILRILAMLGADDMKTSELLYAVVQDVLGSAECNSNIGQAICYECIRTITTIYPNSPLVERAAQAIVRFVTASNNNWKYLGINALTSLVQINPKYVAEHQSLVIDCLDDPDETLKRKTLDLLFKMTNPHNVTAITDKLIDYLRQTRDDYIRSDLVGKITQLAERFAPDNQWFIQTMNIVFELGGSLVRREVAHNLMRLIAEGTEDEETDAELRLDAVSSYLELLDKQHLPDILVKIICWVVGEYAYVKDDVETEEVLEKITLLLGSRFEDPDTHGWVVTAITKLVSQLGYMPDSVQSQIALYLTSTNTDIQQRCCELVELTQDLAMMQAVLPLDSSCDDLEVDSSLSFLDGFVSEALAQGAPAYKPPHLRAPMAEPKQQASPQASIKYQPYALPPPASVTYHSPAAPRKRSPVSSLSKEDTEQQSNIMGVQATSSGSSIGMSSESAGTMSGSAVGGGGSGGSPAVGDYQYTPRDSASGGGLAVKARVWGREGYRKTVPIVTETPPPSTQDQPREQEYVDSADTPTESSPQLEREGFRGTTALSTAQATVVQLSPEELKRKQLASQIFGGLSGPSRAPRSRQQRKSSSSDTSVSSTKTSQLHSRVGGSKKSKEPQVDLLLDLQDIDFSQPSGQSQGAPHVSVPAPTSSGGLLDNLDVRTPQVVASVVTSSVTPSTSASDDLLGLFDGPLSTSQPPQPINTTLTQNHMDTPPPPGSQQKSGAAIPPQVSSDISLLDPTPMGIQPQLVPPESQGSLALTLFENPVGSLRVPTEFTSFPVSHGWEQKDICNDANLRVTLTKVLKPDELVLVIFLTNQKQSGITGVTLSVEHPSNMKTTTGDLTLTTDISGFGNVTHVIGFLPTAPAINMSMRGEISYKDSMATQRRLFFDTTIHISDVIRPLEITTQEFGKKWGSFTYEKKLKLQGSVKKVAEFMDIMKTRFNFYPVQIIGSEGITAGTFLPNVTCLVHGKVHKTHTDFWVRTPSSLLTESIIKQAQAVFK